MIKVNPYFSDLQNSYLFSRIKTMVDKEQAKEENNTLEIIKLGIGDVTKALVPAVVSAFHAGVDEMASDESFCGYGPESGYEFLRSDIAKNDFQVRGIEIHSDEIIVSDGSKCDTGNFQELFDHKIKVAVPDPVYPVYV